MEQKPLSLFLCAEGQHSHDLIQRFPLTDYILRGSTVRQASLGSYYVLVTLPAIPIPLLFPVKFSVDPLALLPKLSNRGGDFDGYHALVSFDGKFHLAFSFRSVFAGAEQKEAGSDTVLETEKRPYSVRLYERMSYDVQL